MVVKERKKARHSSTKDRSNDASPLLVPKISMKGKGTSNDTFPLATKGKTQGVSPSLPLMPGTKSNDNVSSTHTPRTNVYGELGNSAGDRAKSSSSKHTVSTSTISSTGKKRKTDFHISESHKKLKMENVFSKSDTPVDAISIPTQSDMEQKVNELVGYSSSEADLSDSSDSDFNFDELKQDYLDDDEIDDYEITWLFSGFADDIFGKECIYF
uniref:Uncharacterized protein n=1 Tax=Clytia hemisphaerica TaxID=252671 RepID=A0A7M5UWQ0_9CNID